MAELVRGKGKRKRSTRGHGRLFKKVGSKQVAAESTAKGNFYLTYYVNGKRTTEALRDEKGDPITDRKQAEASRKRILAPYQTGDEVETLKAIKARIVDVEAQHAAAFDEANPPLRISEAWQTYLETPERPDTGKGTMNHYEGNWKRFQKWIGTAHPAAVYLRDVSPAIAADYANDLAAARLSPNSYNKHIGFLRMAFRILSDKARMTANPFDKIKRKLQRPHSRRELTIAELVTLLECEGDLGLLLLIGASTGLRLGDCCTLTWGDVDLTRGIIRRIPNKTAKNGKPVIVGIPPALHERLSLVPRRRRTGYVLHEMAERYKRDAATITNEVKAHLWECGIDVHAPGTGSRIKRDKKGGPKREENGKISIEHTGKPAVVDVGFHSLRHTWVSMHAAAGTPGSVIQNSVGHSNPAMTAHYTHVNEITARDVARALPAFAGAGYEYREPLPPWACELIKTLTTKNVKTVRAQLLKVGAE